MSASVAPEKQIRPIDQFRQQLVQMESQIKAVLPPSVTVDRFTRVVLTGIQGKPELLNMDRTALFTACLNCAKDGLIPDGKEAALVPFKGKPQYMPMIRGIIKTIHNSGGVATITPMVVYEKDKFRYWVDDKGVHLEHEPTLSEAGKIVAFYAIAKMRSGETEIEVMTKAEIDKIRAVSLAKSGGPWNDWYEEMGKKTTIRRLSKRLPLSAEAERVIQRDDDMYDLNGTKAANEKSADMTAAIRESMAKALPGPEATEETKDAGSNPPASTEPAAWENETPATVGGPQ